MEKQKRSLFEALVYLIIGLIYPVAYYLLMTVYFKMSPFQGWYWLPTTYLAICYVFYPVATRKFSEWSEDKEINWFVPVQTAMLLAYLFAPIIVIMLRDE